MQIRSPVALVSGVLSSHQTSEQQSWKPKGLTVSHVTLFDRGQRSTTRGRAASLSVWLFVCLLAFVSVCLPTWQHWGRVAFRYCLKLSWIQQRCQMVVIPPPPQLPPVSVAVPHGWTSAHPFPRVDLKNENKAKQLNLNHWRWISFIQIDPNLHILQFDFTILIFYVRLLNNNSKFISN